MTAVVAVINTTIATVYITTATITNIIKTMGKDTDELYLSRSQTP